GTSHLALEPDRSPRARAAPPPPYRRGCPRASRRDRARSGGSRPTPSCQVLDAPAPVAVLRHVALPAARPLVGRERAPVVAADLMLHPCRDDQDIARLERHRPL